MFGSREYARSAAKNGCTGLVFFNRIFVVPFDPTGKMKDSVKKWMQRRTNPSMTQYQQ